MLAKQVVILSSGKMALMLLFLWALSAVAL
jgi:hypothetical protein